MATHHRLTSETFNIPEHTEGPVLFSENSGAVSSEDILAKYRKKPADDKVDANDMSSLQQRDEETFDPTEKITRDNAEASFVFQDARRKLRLVLSEVGCRISIIYVILSSIHKNFESLGSDSALLIV